MIYSLKRRWGKRVTLYSITASVLDLDSGQKVLTKTSKVINKAVFLPPKQIREVIKQQAAFDPRATTVLIDKKEVYDFPIKLDDYLIRNHWRFVITEISDHDSFYALRVHSVGRMIEPLVANDTLTLTELSYE